MPGSSSTKAPKSATRVTVPRTRSPVLYFSRDRVPRMRLQLLHAERNALLLRVDLQDLGFDLLAGAKAHRQGLSDAAPGNVGHVQQAIDAANIDEGSVVGQGCAPCR